MPQIRHPLSLGVYDLDAESGDVVVVDRNGRTGRFDGDGVWLSGELRQADPELCRWLSGPRLMSRHRVIASSATPESNAVQGAS